MAHHNRLLGEFNLEGIPPAARGVPQIEVKFDIDQNGILNVSARDVSSGKQASVRLEETSALSKDEIDRMKRDAEEHAEEDRRQFELAEARNKGQHLVYQLEKQMKDNADKLSDADRQPLTAAIDKLKTAIEGTELEPIKSATSELEQARKHSARYCTRNRHRAPLEPAARPRASPGGQADDDASMPSSR